MKKDSEPVEVAEAAFGPVRTYDAERMALVQSGKDKEDARGGACDVKLRLLTHSGLLGSLGREWSAAI